MATTNTDIAKKLDELAVNFGAFSENVGIRLSILEEGQKRLIAATYGNGEPGIKEKIREHDKVITEIVGGGTKPVREISERVKKLEETHAVCHIVRLEKSVEEIEKRHSKEDKIIEHVIEDKEQEQDAARKFRWETIAMAVGLILNLIFTLLHSYLK